MKPSIEINSAEFQKAVREALLATSKELPKAITSRLFYLMVRAFAILPPRNVKASKNAIRQYLREKVQPRTGKPSKGLQRVHLIAQAKSRDKGEGGLYGADMRKASGAYARRAVGSVGYLKSAIVRVLKNLNGHFTQFGTEGRPAKHTKKARREIPPNTALSKIASEYGSSGNVSLHKGSKGTGYPAQPGFNPTAKFSISTGVRDSQIANVTSKWDSGLGVAMRDEMTQIKNHLADKMQEIADRHNP